MTSFNFVDSQYRFTSPIRYFKANDPIYYEVDNIPLKQLHENDLWLKDQIFTLKQQDSEGVNRSSINELLPYVDGFDNIVKVKPGRFSARINDAYNLTPLQIISRLSFSGVDGYNTWQVAGMSAPNLSNILEKFKQAVALDLNGLSERAFAKVAFLPDLADTTYSNANNPKIDIIVGPESKFSQPPYPGVGMTLWGNFTDPRDSSLLSTYYRVRQYDPDQTASIGFAKLGLAETAFIKKWRGVARTAIVDIPEELSIEIPEFNPEDHFYYNSAGVKTFTNASQRIDLVFIYSKPIDASSTTIPKFVNGNPTTITQPQLGIVYGAGVGVNFKGSPEKNQPILSPAGIDKGLFPETDNSTLADGTVKMLSHFGDENGTNTGFSLSGGGSIKGSFPSPDDLMNIAPLLDEELSASNIALIGQSVLPVAYVVVKRQAQRNLDDGTPIIEKSDLIDIRPFFRTTELTYNERAGLAAAVPAPSIANPIVTQAELDYELKSLRTDVISRIPILPDQVGAPIFGTFYTQYEKTVWLDNPELLNQGIGTTNQWGSRLAPRNYTLDRVTLPSGDPVFFPDAANTRRAYKSNITELIIQVESTIGVNDSDILAMFAAAYGGSVPVSQIETLKYNKIAAAGMSINDGNVRSNTDTGGSNPLINVISIPIKASETISADPLAAEPVPDLPITLRTYVSRVNYLYNSDATPVFLDGFAAGSGPDRYNFNLLLIGYKVMVRERFKAISMG